MADTPKPPSALGIWVSGCFVAGFFLFIWILAVLRLHGHQHAEIFLHRGGLTDSLIALLAPFAMFARFLQVRNDLKARNA